jgi:type VI secretion system protein ImpM
MTQRNTASDGASAGFYGKLPSLGDFVSRRLPARFLQPWDLWLRESVAASQGQLGQEWLEHYLTSPLWRFVLSPGIAGQTGWAGVLMPSVDRVGRYFPLTLACPLSPDTNPFRLLCTADWFERTEAIALSALAEGFDLSDFDSRVLGLGPVQPQAPTSATVAVESGVQNAWQVEVPSVAQLPQACQVLLGRALDELFFAYSLWWTSGSERVAPSLLASQGLPAPDGFVGLLAGDWDSRGWQRLGPT